MRDISKVVELDKIDGLVKSRHSGENRLLLTCLTTQFCLTFKFEASQLKFGQ